jgi:VCBS repeat-containing protein
MGIGLNTVNRGYAMKRTFFLSLLAVAAATCLAPVSSLRAASVSWGPPTTVTNVTDIDLTGTNVHAGSWGTTNLAVDVGGVETIIFEDRPINTTDDEAGVTSNNEQGLDGQYYSGDTGSTNFNAIMDSNAGGQTKVLTLKKLVPGATYQVQLFLSDERAGEGSRTQKWSDNAIDGAGNESAAVQRNLAPSVIGTFVADATSIIIYGLPISHADTILSAYALRKTVDAAPGFFFGPPSGSVVEGGSAGSYDLQTSTLPASNLTVAVTAPAGIEVSLDGATYSNSVATVLDGITPGALYYRAPVDGTLDPAETVDIAHTITSGDGGDYPTSMAGEPYSVAVSDAPVGNVGDIAVYNNAGATPVGISAEGGTTPTITNRFTSTAVAPLSSYALDSDGKGVIVSAGRHLALYNNRIDHVAGANRAELQTHLTLESGGSVTPLAYGRAQGFIRNQDGADETVISGGTILVAGTNDILRLHTTRTDVNAAKSVQVEPGHTAIQLLKLDDSMDCLRVSRAASVSAASSAAFVPVTYDTVDEVSSGAMGFTAGSGNVTFTNAGHYIVMANTYLRRVNDNNTRTGYTQQLALDGTAINGSKTTVYLRGSGNGEQANDGTLAVGMIIEVATNQVLTVQQSREGAQDANIIGGLTALAVVRLPDSGEFIKLRDTTGQNINPGGNNGDASPAVAMTFAEQLGAPAAVFGHTISNSQVTINADGRYLFLGGFFCDDDTAARQVPNQQWALNGTVTGYGESSRYSRNQNVQNNGNWSGILAPLSAGDTVEMTSRRLANGTVMPGHSMGLQGASILSLTANPVLLVNALLPLGPGETGTITSNHLLTVDVDTDASNLTYTVDSVPTGGALRKQTIPIGISNTFTQNDIDDGDIDFVAGAVLGSSYGFAFSVSDGGGNPASGFFTVGIGAPIVLTNDTGTTDEDTLLAELAGGATSVLANDGGVSLSETAYDATSANGATVTVNADGTFTYDPEPATALQQLGMSSGPLADSFTYTVTDAIGKMATATVTVDVTEIEDTFAAVDNYVDDPVNRIWENAGASITMNLAANDGVVRLANGTTNDILVLNYDATGSAGMGRWENLGSVGSTTMDWILGRGVTLGAVTSVRGGISAAYTWDGSTDATAGLNSGGDSIDDILGGALTVDDASFEVWAKLDAEDLTQISSLYESGGTTGTGILVSNGVLRAANGIRAGEVTYDLMADNQNLFGIGEEPTNEFFQVVFVVDLANDRNALYVNGTLVGTAANPATTDWSGADGSGLGHFRGTAHGGFQNAAAGTIYDTYYRGSIAICRIYSEALSPAEVYQNFHAIDAGGRDVEDDVLSAWGIYDANTNLVGGTGTPVPLPSGGIVTLDSQFTDFTYDPTGIAGITDLVASEVLIDSFDVLIAGVVGPSDVATVRVAIHGLNQASDDTLAATEHLVTTFAASELVGNDQYSPGAARPFIRLDANAVTATNEALGLWPNRGTGGAAYDGTINGGTLVDAESGFGAIGKVWQGPRTTVASLDPISTADATFEVWFKPEFASSGKQVLFETGGNGNGSSIAYDADQNRVVCTADCGADGDANVQLRADVGGISYDEFNQLVMRYDRDNPGLTDSLKVYLNNDPAAFDATPDATVTNATGASDWAGTDAGGVGTVAGTAALNEALSGFAGRVAGVRVYDRALDTTEMEANFDAMRNPMVSTSPAMTPLGATVTRNGDGSVSYDATALSTNIPAGQVVQDTFTYTISDGVGGTTMGTVTINVTGVGSFYALDDTGAVGEDGPAVTFDPRTNDIGAAGATIELQTAVAGFLADFQSGTNAGQTADFTATTGWRYMWNAPTDWNGIVSSNGTTGAFGTSADYELMKWTGSYWSPDGDQNTGNGAPAGYTRISPDGSGHPGLGYTQNGGISNNLPRGPIAAYTVGTDGAYGIANSFLTKVQTAGQDGIDAVVYVNDALVNTVNVAPGTTADFDTGLGQLSAGDTVYVGISPISNAGSDTFNWDFEIVTLPTTNTPLNDTLGIVTTDGTNITYDPNGQFEKLPVGQTTTETFGYTVSDGTNTSSADVTVEISGENDAPIGVADGGATDEDSPAVGEVLANDTDIDQGDVALGFAVDQVQGATGNVGMATATDIGGLVTLQADGNYVYDPTNAFQYLAVGENGSDTFSYVVADSHGLAATAATTVTVSIAGTDDGVIATENDYAVDADLTLAGNVITDDTGDGVDLSIDVGDPLMVQSVDTNGMQGLLTIATHKFMGTRGTIANLTDAAQTVTFDAIGGRFDSPVIFVSPPSYNEGEPTVALISNVTATTFDVWLKEQPEAGSVTNDMDGATHAAETLSWFALEAGKYQLTNGMLVEVGTVETKSIRHAGTGGSSWQTVTFSVPFTTAPAVFNHIQTFSGSAEEKEELFGTRMNGRATTNSFQVAMEDHEGDDAARSTLETIGWMAIEPGSGNWDGNPFEVGFSANNIEEIWRTINFANNYGTAPDFISSQATIAGVDPTQLRMRNLGTNSVDILGAEDRFSDAEVGHAAETVTYLAVGGTGDLVAYHLPHGSFIYDPTTAFGGAGTDQTETFTYTLTDGRGNTDTKTVTIRIRATAGTMLIVR